MGDRVHLHGGDDPGGRGVHGGGDGSGGATDHLAAQYPIPRLDHGYRRLTDVLRQRHDVTRQQ